MPKGSHGASYARPGERETSGKIKERAEKEREEREKGEGACGGRHEGGMMGRGQGEGKERAKYLRGGPKRQGSRGGGTGIFSSRCIDARKNGVKAPLALPSATTPRTTLIPLPFSANLDAEPLGPTAGRRSRGERAAAAAESRRGRIREDGRHSNLSWQVCLPAWLACLFPRSPVCSPLAKSPS